MQVRTLDAVLREVGALCFVFAAGAAAAQQVYKSVGPDGRTVYSERPPADGKVEKKLEYAPQPATPLSNSYVEQLKRFQATSPTVVSIPAGRPVLYSAAWCGYCKQAKAFMAAKGIGFTEFDIDTKEGLAAFASAGGGKGIPLLVHGPARVQGFSQASYEAVFAKGK